LCNRTVRDILHALSVIPARYEHVPIRNTHAKYRKLMKHGYSKSLYSQRNKDETIVSVIKRLFGEHVTSRLVKTQNRELSFRCIAYNTHRLTNLIIILVSTEPIRYNVITIHNWEKGKNQLCTLYIVILSLGIPVPIFCENQSVMYPILARFPRF
jgi:hypothetical protein